MALNALHCTALPCTAIFIWLNLASSEERALESELSYPWRPQRCMFHQSCVHKRSACVSWGAKAWCGVACVL